MKNAWEEAESELDRLSKVRGGPHNLYKPVVRIEWYEHDGCLSVEVGRSKSMDEPVIRVFRNGPDLAPILLDALREATVRAEAASS